MQLSCSWQTMEFNLYIFGIWRIWISGNKLIFQKRVVPISNVIHIVKHNAMKYYSFPLGLGFGTLNPPSTTLLSLEEYLYLYSNKSHHFLNHPIFFNNVFVGPFLKFHYIYIVIVFGPKLCDINFKPKSLGIFLHF